MRSRLLLLLLLASPAPSARADIDLDLTVGRLSMNDANWYPLENQDLIRLEFGYRRSSSSLSWRLELFASRDQQPRTLRNGRRVEQRATQRGVGVGFLHEWRRSQKLRPYLGAGIGRVEGKINVIGVADDNPTGFVPFVWVRGGARYQVARHVHIGLDVRVRESQRDAAPRLGTDFSGVEYAFLTGVSWD